MAQPLPLARPLRNPPFRALALLVCLLFLSSCTIRSVTAIDVSADGSGTLAITVALDEEFRALIEESSGEALDWDDPETFVEADLASSELPPSAEVNSYSDGGFKGFTATVAFESLAELNSILAAAGEDSGGVLLSITEPTEGRFELSVSDEYMAMLAELGESGSTPSSMIEDLVDVRLEVALPGKLLEHNGTVSGDAVVWKLSAGDPSQAAPYALSQVGGSSPWPFVLALLAVGLIVGYFLVSSRLRALTESADPADADAVTDALSAGFLSYEEE